MRKLILLYSIIGLFILGCGEADTIDPTEDPFRVTDPTVGSVKSIDATLGELPSVANPCIVINFDTPAHGDSIKYGTTNPTILVYYDGGLLNYMTGYEADPDNPADYESINTIFITLLSPTPAKGKSVRVRLTGVYSYADKSIKLPDKNLNTQIQ